LPLTDASLDDAYNVTRSTGLRSSKETEMPRPLIGVMGSGNDSFAEMAEPLGRWIAEQGLDLLTGGGGGIMAAVCRGFATTPNRKGLCIGVLPARAPAGYPNEWVEIAIHTHLSARGPEGAGAHSRNHINVLSSTAIVVLPGKAGTRTEMELAIYYRKPVIAYLGEGGTIEGMKRNEIPRIAKTQAEVEAFISKEVAAAQAPKP
jgi:uncharacterized protein (TIGR00725 family)